MKPLVGNMEEPHPHVVILPFPAQGHIKPMFMLAKLLCHAGINITFVNTDHNHTRILDLIARTSFQNQFPRIQFMSIPDGLPPEHPRNGPLLMDLFDSNMSVSMPHFKDLLADKSHTKATAPQSKTPRILAMSPIISLTLSLLCLSSFIIPPPISDAADDGDALSAYEVLENYDFPVGLLPKGATGYDLDKANGKFRAYFNGSCSFSLEGSYQLKYRSTIDGHIEKGKLTNLSGVSVKVLFMWLNIVEVVRNGDELEFSVGIASADFPIDNFGICPQCGCGLDCNSNRQVRKIRTNSFLSSV